MDKIYILHKWSYDGHEILGAFYSKEDAEIQAGINNYQIKSDYYEYYVTEANILPSPERNPNYELMEVIIPNKDKKQWDQHIIFYCPKDFKLIKIEGKDPYYFARNREVYEEHIKLIKEVRDRLEAELKALEPTE